MSADSPPTYYFTGIQFNSSFYNNTSGGGTGDLTQALADTLYLRKTVADTATVVETFSNANGIKTNKVEPVLTTGNDLILGSTISASNRVSIGKLSGGLGVNFPSGVSAQVIDTFGTSGVTSQMAIAGTRATALTIGKTTYSTTINSALSFPLKVSNIDSVNPADQFLIGTSNSGGVVVGGSLGGTSIASAFFMYNNQPTNDDAYMEVVNTPADVYLFTSTIAPPNAITLGSPTVPLTLDVNTFTLTTPASIGIGKEVAGLNPASTTTLRGLLNLTNGLGTSGQVLTSGGSGGSLTWATASGGGSFQAGSFVPTYSSTASVASPAFTTTFTTTNPPTVLLTCDVGSGSTSIVIPCVAGFQGSAGAWTGFYYLLSASGATKLNYFAS